VLNTSDPALAEQLPEDVLDAAIFGPARFPVRDVVAGGRFVVREGRHMNEEPVFARYRATMARLAES
jgi:formimidoylglutamate deiminase